MLTTNADLCLSNSMLFLWIFLTVFISIEITTQEVSNWIRNNFDLGS